MERIAFLIEHTGQRVFAMVNPEELTFQRRSGVAQRSRNARPLGAAGRSHDPLIAVGGGATDLLMNLLFDVDLLARGTPSFTRTPDPEPAATSPAAAGPSAAELRPPAIRDVRELSGPLWRLAENTSSRSGAYGPPIAHFIWGAAWDMPCVALSVAERFDHFSNDGVPLRSWMRIHLRRVEEPARPAEPAADFSPFAAEGDGSPVDPENPPDAVVIGDAATSSRPDAIVQGTYGDLRLLHPLLDYNDVDDVWSLEGGVALLTPPASVLLGQVA